MIIIVSCNFLKLKLDKKTASEKYHQGRLWGEGHIGEHAVRGLEPAPNFWRSM
jgi:hypothetical protein